MRHERAQEAIVSPAREGQVKPPSLSLGSQPLCRSWSGQLQECSEGSYASPRITGTFGFSASHGICTGTNIFGYRKTKKNYTYLSGLPVLTLDVGAVTALILREQPELVLTACSRTVVVIG